jgi:hypothetical protein
MAKILLDTLTVIIVRSKRSFINLNLQSNQSCYQVTAYGALPRPDPVVTVPFDMTIAEAKALGVPKSDTNLDGVVWLSLDHLNNNDFTFASRAAQGQFDAIGTLEHEISEVMGRVSFLGPVVYVPLDLFRYTNSKPPQRFFGNILPDSAATVPGWFSFDGKNTLMQYDNGQHGLPGTQGDFADWINGTQKDAFSGAAVRSQEQDVTPIDLLEMNVLGWQLAPTALKQLPQCPPAP